MLREVVFVITKEDLVEVVDKLKAFSKQGYGKVPREARRVVEGGMKAVANIEDGAMRPAEGEVARADMVEGGLGGGCVMGGVGCEVGNGSSK